MKQKIELKNILMEDAQWCNYLGISDIESLNRVIRDGKSIQLVNLCEAKHENNISHIVHQIVESKAPIVLLAGPSSSGKTSTSLRIALQCKVHGLNPITLELDNYFVEREQTPVGADGKPDFECLEAMDIALLNDHLSKLIQGEEVEIPSFNFLTGHKEYRGNKVQLRTGDILIMEGIHALDPELTPEIPDFCKFLLFVSDLSSVSDYTPGFDVSDNRLLRRIARDLRSRGYSAENTINQWPSVRAGEEKYIIKFAPQADAFFNSCIMYELPLLKQCVIHKLNAIEESSPAYAKASQLIGCLNQMECLPLDALLAIPCTSIMREFIGQQVLSRELL